MTTEFNKLFMVSCFTDNIKKKFHLSQSVVWTYKSRWKQEIFSVLHGDRFRQKEVLTVGNENIRGYILFLANYFEAAAQMANLSVLLILFLISRQTYISPVHAKQVRELFRKDLKKILEKIIQTERLQLKNSKAKTEEEEEHYALDDYPGTRPTKSIDKTGWTYVIGPPDPPDLPPPPQFAFKDLPSIPPPRYKKDQTIRNKPAFQYYRAALPGVRDWDVRLQPAPAIPAFPELPDWNNILKALRLDTQNGDSRLKRTGNRRW